MRAARSVGLILLLLAGCSDSPPDPVTTTLTARDSTLESLERFVRPEHYWSKKVASLEKSLSEARESFQSSNQEYRTLLLTRRESVIQAVQEAKAKGGNTRTARLEAVQAHRTALAQSRDKARDAGRELRIRLALMRKAQEFLDKAK